MFNRTNQNFVSEELFNIEDQTDKNFDNTEIHDSDDQDIPQSDDQNHFFRGDSLGRNFELLNLTKDDSQLPYIVFSGTHFKMLIDTGSAKSFINPVIADRYYKEFIRKDRFQITTAHGMSYEKFST